LSPYFHGYKSNALFTLIGPYNVMLRFLVIVLIWGCLACTARAETLTAISYDGGNVVLQFSSDAAPKVFSVGEGKPRIVVDVPRGDMNIEGKTLEKGPQTLDGQGAVNLGGKTAVRTVVTTVSAPRYFENSVPYPRLSPKGAITLKRKPVIVIDPGHGGRDPGAIGGLGTHEKKITWASAKELQRQLLATGRYKVIMTRTKDVYVEHKERIRIARAGGADLFISIHADSAGNKTARGASVYTLADRAKNRSKRIVNSQNWIMDVDLTEKSDTVGDILVDLAQRSTSSQSEAFADILLEELGASTQLIGNSHRRAGYFVLLAPDVPAVLLEMGFLSNKQDEKLLKNERHRKKVLKSVTRSINTYFDSQK